YFFFFQAEDGIRDLIVTGVQTCALPISSSSGAKTARGRSTATFSRPAVPAIEPLRRTKMLLICSRHEDSRVRRAAGGESHPQRDAFRCGHHRGSDVVDDEREPQRAALA